MEIRVAGRSKHRKRSGANRSISGARTRTALIRMPHDLIAEQPAQRLAILSCLQSAENALVAGAKVRLDFSNTRRAFPGGILLLAGVCHSLCSRFPGRLIATVRTGTQIERSLNVVGLAKQLRLPACQPPESDALNENPWDFISGTNADGALVDGLLSKYRSHGYEGPDSGLYDVVTEALTNVRQHAYKDSHIEPALHKWWMLAKQEPHADNSGGDLYIAIYDIGVGIQASLREKLRTGEQLLELGDEIMQKLRLSGSRRVLDRLLLSRAVEHRRSRTGATFRGYGLLEMRDYVLKTKNGRLYIVSGNSQHSTLASTQRSSCISCDSPLLGTLILWSIPLTKQEQKR